MFSDANIPLPPDSFFPFLLDHGSDQLADRRIIFRDQDAARI